MAAACLRNSASLGGVLFQDSSAALKASHRSPFSLTPLRVIGTAAPIVPSSVAPFQLISSSANFQPKIKLGFGKMEPSKADQLAAPHVTGHAEAVAEEKVADVIDGKAIAAQLRKEIAQGVESLKTETGKVGSLAMIGGAVASLSERL